MNKLTIANNTINVFISEDEDHPGVIIQVGNKQIARVELDQEAGSVNAYLWDETKQEDYLHKVSTQVPVWVTLPDNTIATFWDVNAIADAENIKISDEEKVTIAETVINEFEQQDYNEYIKDLLTS